MKELRACSVRQAEQHWDCGEGDGGFGVCLFYFFVVVITSNL